MPAAARRSPSVSRAARQNACHAISRISPWRKRPTWYFPMLSRSDGWKIALAIPGAKEVLWFKKPAVFVHDQFLTKVHDKEDAMTLRVSSMEMRDMMLEAEPGLFYITDHYRNFPFVLARLKTLTPKVLKEMLVGRAAQLAETAAKVAKRKKRPEKKSTGKGKSTKISPAKDK